MCVTARAQYLDAAHAVRAVLARNHCFIRGRIEEARPAGAGPELGVGIEQRQIAADAMTHAIAVVLPQPAGDGAFGAAMARYLILVRRQPRLPFGIGLVNVFHVIVVSSVAVPMVSLDGLDADGEGRVGDRTVRPGG